MKAKWTFPFVSWIGVGYQAALTEHWGHRALPQATEIKMLYLVGAIAWMVATLAVVQPWREDPR